MSATSPEMARESGAGPIYGADLTIAGLRPVVVPKLHDGHAIVADTSIGFRNDAVAIKVRVRLAAIIAVPARSARALSVNATTATTTSKGRS